MLRERFGLRRFTLRTRPCGHLGRRSASRTRRCFVLRICCWRRGESSLVLLEFASLLLIWAYSSRPLLERPERVALLLRALGTAQACAPALAGHLAARAGAQVRHLQPLIELTRALRRASFWSSCILRSRRCRRSCRRACPSPRGRRCVLLPLPRISKLYVTFLLDYCR
jgi:hypothetical protein